MSSQILCLILVVYSVSTVTTLNCYTCDRYGGPACANGGDALLRCYDGARTCLAVSYMNMTTGRVRYWRYCTPPSIQNNVCPYYVGLNVTVIRCHECDSDSCNTQQLGRN